MSQRDTRPVTDDAEWARETEKRVADLEVPGQQRIGAWVISEDADNGNLIASHGTGGSQIILTVPDESAEAVEPEPEPPPGVHPGYVVPFAMFAASSDQSIPNTSDTTFSNWSLIAQQGNIGVGAWTIKIQEAGWYRVDVQMAFQGVTVSGSNQNRAVKVMKNGQTVGVHSVLSNTNTVFSSGNHDNPVNVHGYLNLAVNDELFVSVFQNSTVSLGAGGAYFGNVRGSFCVERCFRSDVLVSSEPVLHTHPTN